MKGRCVDNARLELIGCGAVYGGERQHCIARVLWSEHPDGRAHVTAALSTIDTMWSKGGIRPAHPADCGFVQPEPGRWIKPMSDEDRARARRPVSAAAARTGSTQTPATYPDSGEA